jgi:hypothetical protein
MSKKKKEKVEEAKKNGVSAEKDKPAKAAKGKKNIVPASLPVLVQTAAPATPEAAPAPKAKKAAPKKKPAAKKTAKPSPAEEPAEDMVVVEEIVISNDDIALRAYFIAEKRRAHGHWGDEAGDWIEAERQLREEATQKKR